MRVEEVYYGKTAEKYENNRSDDKWEKENNAFIELFSDAIKRCPKSKITVLDIPCGTGRWLPYLEGKVKSYYGVDVSKDMIKEARKKDSEISFETNFIEKGWKDFTSQVPKGCDLVICTRFLGHWKKKDAKKIIEDALLPKTQHHLILQVRVNDSFIERLFEYVSILFLGPKVVKKKLKKSGRLTRSHCRKTFLNILKTKDYHIIKSIVVSKSQYSSFEYWLVEHK